MADFQALSLTAVARIVADAGRLVWQSPDHRLQLASLQEQLTGLHPALDIDSFQSIVRLLSNTGLVQVDRPGSTQRPRQLRWIGPPVRSGDATS